MGGTKLIKRALSMQTPLFQVIIMGYRENPWEVEDIGKQEERRDFPLQIFLISSLSGLSEDSETTIYEIPIHSDEDLISKF
ncbi:hypothetical protein NPIL_264841 [Nephila pilipes]|uniref:Uncharacterized protein n=1 Tax=Nephila pilipes TaxID=299642 RepID=A0A8X6TRZ3_NEPPI|nr:hypothetical protein NPIL_264841 [Nephila pilipes]